MKLKLVQKKRETPDVITFIFEPQETLSWKAGQYLHYVLHHLPTDGRGSDRWFTNAAAPFEKQVRITTRIAKDKGSSFKAKLNALVIGKNIEIAYVEGDFTVEDLTEEYVFIIGGIGITPVRSILKQLDFEKKQIKATLLYANRDQNIVYKDDLEEAAKNNPNLTIHYIFSPEKIDEAKIRELVPDIQQPVFYISGPEPMVISGGEILKSMGITEDKIRFDEFPGYASY